MKKKWIFGFECGEIIIDILSTTKREAIKEIAQVFGEAPLSYLGKRPA